MRRILIIWAALLGLVAVAYASSIPMTGAGGKWKAASAPPAYQAYGVNFANSPYITRGAALTGGANTQYVTLSFWFRVTGLDSTLQQIFANNISRVSLIKWTDNQIYFSAKNGAATDVLTASTTISSGFTTAANTGWHHFIFSGDMYTTARTRLDRSATNTTAAATASGIIDGAASNWSVGATTAGVNKIHMDIAELWYSNVLIDISNSAELDKFITSGLKPVNLGANGETPTGTPPLIYMKSNGTANDIITNLGSGGIMSLITGTLNNSGTNP